MSPRGSYPCRRWRGGLCRSLCALARSRTGNVAILFALLSIPMIGATGVAIDYARAQSMQTRLRTALDAAVLAGVNQETGHQVDRAQAVFSLNFRDPSLLVDV